jgi:RNA 3'-terminal phosphate cyclase (ATP)
MLLIDGSSGEGGGQILRSALALSMVTGTPFRIEKIRAGRSRPGLLRQHLTAVQAACDVAQADIEGAAIGSTCLSFAPRGVRPSSSTFSVGTAGSTTLVLQTILLPLLLAPGPSSVAFEGGTHNPFAPPFDFLAQAYMPLLARMGAQAQLRLERPGFYPAGGGRFTVQVQPCAHLAPIELLERGEPLRRRARAIVANLPRHIGEREIEVIGRLTGWPAEELCVESMSDGRGPGNVVLLKVEFEHVTEVFTGFGERGVRAEVVAERAVDEYRRYLEAGAPVGEHLADQLMLPLAIAGGGAFRTMPLTPHAQTHLELIGKFLDVAVAVETAPDGARIVRFG